MKEIRIQQLKVPFILIVVYIIFAMALQLFLNNRKTENHKQHLHLISERYQLAYNTIYDQYRQFAHNIHIGIVERYDLVGVYEALETATEVQKDYFRKELYRKIAPRFEKLRKTAKVRQFHFFLKDNTSFLRMHMPERYGDDLSNIRETVSYVNSQHRPIDGFEVGTTFNSYRFVSPIFSQDNRYLGCVGVSFGPDTFTSAIMKQYFVLSNFFIKEQVIKDKQVHGKQSNLYFASHHTGYLFDKNVLAALKDVTAKDMSELRPSKETVKQIYQGAHLEDVNSLYDADIDSVFTTIPIRNPVTEKMVAFLSIRSRPDYFKESINDLAVITFLSNLVLIMFLSFIYMEYYNKRKIWEDANIKQLQLAANVLENIAEGVVVTDTDGNIISVNSAVLDISGYREKDLLGQSTRIWKSHHHDKAFYKGLWDALLNKNRWQGEIWNRRKNGDVYPALMTITGLKDETGELKNYVSVFSDISTAKESQEMLEHLAQYDQLTELPNRVLLHDRMEQALFKAERDGQMLGLMLLDLDNFKTVNDLLGHKSGDILLMLVAERLLSCVRNSDTVARLGGDEFVVLLPDCKSADNIIVVTRKILRKLSAPFDIEENQVFVSASIGITVYPNDGETSDVLLQNADTAMYHIKQNEKNNFQFFTASMQEHILTRIKLSSELRLALTRDEFFVLYQPKVDLDTGKITGMETLVRWQHPEYGLINPGDFIPLAEETGIIIPLGEWVLRQACEQCKRWQDDGLGALRISVNISGRQFKNENLLEMVASVIQDTGIEAGLLELEITETTIIQDIEVTIDILWKLREIGVLLSIDDFGTGYSSLNYLKRFPLDILKIDRSFIMDLNRDPNDRAVVEAIISLSRHLKMKVIAEGVETVEQLNFLKKEQCDEVQGYLIAKPLPAEEFKAFVLENRSGVKSLDHS